MKRKNDQTLFWLLIVKYSHIDTFFIFFTFLVIDMRTLALLGVTLVALAAGVSARPNAQVVYITLAFCPTDFTSKGAVVSVDTLTGAYRVVNTFDWPKEIFGWYCDEKAKTKTFSTPTPQSGPVRPHGVL